MKHSRQHQHTQQTRTPHAQQHQHTQQKHAHSAIVHHKKHELKAGAFTLFEHLKQPPTMYFCLLWLFCVLAILLYLIDLSGQSWQLLAVSAIVFFALELSLNWRGSLDARIKKAIFMGAFLLLFDFVFETSGALFGLWGPRNSLFIIGAVPVEVMAITFFGGIAWSLYLPKKFDFTHSLMDILLFSFFGAFGEWLLIKNNVFQYAPPWNSLLAFISYALTWAILHYVNYNIKIEGDNKR